MRNWCQCKGCKPYEPKQYLYGDSLGFLIMVVLMMSSALFVVLIGAQP